MECNEYVDPSLFASTPPIEEMRYILSRAATREGGKKNSVMTVFVSRAYFNAECTTDAYIEMPAEDTVPGDEHRVGKLRLCLYGTKDASHNWAEVVAKQLVHRGYVRGSAFPSVYFNAEEDMVVMVHGDDYLCSGPIASPHKLKGQLAKAFEIKSCMLGDRPGMETEGKNLNRIVRVTKEGWQIEADPRHAELIIQELGLSQAKGLSTPAVDEPEAEEESCRDIDHWLPKRSSWRWIALTCSSR